MRRCQKMSCTTEDVKRPLKEVNPQRVIELGGSGLYNKHIRAPDLNKAFEQIP